jgi:phospholipid/cholesterol/gamma-HCH transport system substrate-binding protein
VNAGRVAVFGAIAVAAVLVALVVLGGGSKHEYKLVFQTAGQLVNDNSVEIGGRRVGAVKNIELTEDNRAEVTVEIEEPYAPLHRGSTAVVRGASLSGVANRYVALTPGPDSEPELEDGAQITEDSTTSIVDLDQLFNTLDEPTRDGLTKVIQGFGDWYAGRGADGNAAAKYFAPSLSATKNFVGQLAADQKGLETLVRETSKVVTALGERGPTLTALVSNTNTSLGAIAAENQSLAEALDLLPQTLRRGSTTFVNLRAALVDLEALVNASGESTKNLAPFLRELTPLLKDAKPTVAQLSKLISTPGASNDFTDLMTDAPALAKQAEPGFKNSIAALNRSIPVLTFIRPYSPEFAGWLKDFGQGAANYDANGHFARISPAFNSFRYDAGSNEFVPVPDSQRQPGLPGGGVPGFTQPGQLIPRCPGSATQPLPDGSNPYRDRSGDLDCNPQIVPPGP